jgi:hypothetical protein
MTFLNPLLLFGIAGIASPIVIHLLAKKKIKHVVWAAMRFLKTVVEKHERRLTLEDVVLLILRCALLALFAVALARPSFKQGGLAGFGDHDEAAIIAIDNSASMSQTDGVASKFEQAQKAAEEVLDSLPGGSAVAVWLVSDVVNNVISEPTHDFALARKAIREGRRSDRATEMPAALHRAVDVLRHQTATGKRIYLITDGQANGWKQLTETRALLDSSRDIRTQIVVIGESEQHNLGVAGLHLTSSFATVNEPIRFEIEIGNYGIAEARNVQVSLGIDNEVPGDSGVIESIPPGQMKTLSLYATFREAGSHAVVARLPGDRNPADDQRALALRVTGEINVLLVDGDPGIEPRESEVFYLRNALTPVPPEERDKYYIKTKTVAPAELATAKLSDYDAVVLADVADLPESVLAALEKYLHAGGGLMVFPGGKINPAFYNQKMFRDRDFLPAAFGDVYGSVEQQDKFFTLQASGYDHPIVSLWHDAAAGNLATAHFYRAFTLVPSRPDVATKAGPPAVVLNYNNGKPAVMERTWGFGRVVQFSSTANAAWNDLCMRPDFVPLLHRVLGALVARDSGELNVRVGATLRAPLETELVGQDVRIVPPDGKSVSLQRIAAANGVPVLQFDRTENAGLYEVRQGDDATPLLRFAVQSDPEESNLRDLTGQEWKALDGVARIYRWSPATNLRAQLEKERTGNEFWMAFLVLALITAAAEMTLGNRWSIAR